MAHHRMRIGFPIPGTYALGAAQGPFSLTGLDAVLSIGTGSGVVYSWDLLSPFAYVDPAKTASGTGTFVDPYSPTQGLAIGPASSGDRVIEWLPGDCSVTTVSSAGPRFAALAPISGASATRRVIHRARNPGNTTAGTRTRIRRTSGAGVIFGFLNNSYAIWDGFMVDTKSGAPEVDNPQNPIWGEVGQMSCWNSNNCKFIRIYSDHQNATYDQGDRNNIFIQTCSFIEIGDCVFRNLANSGGSGFTNLSMLMWYNSDNLDVHHNLFEAGACGIWCKGQTAADSVHTHDYHHNKFRNLGVAVRVSSPIQTTTARAVRVRQNQIYNCTVGVAVTAFQPGEPKGILVVNNTIYNGISYLNFDQYGTQPRAFLVTDADGATFVANSNITFRNNACYNIQEMVHLRQNDSQFDALTWDYNAYNTYTNFWRVGEGGPVSNLSTWQAEDPPRDFHVVTGSPNFVDIANNNITPNTGSPLINAGIDVLNIRGNGTSGPCNIGASVLSNDSFGPR